jgi:hypothetical protein
LAFINHSKAGAPIPSNEFGLVRGFQIPARSKLTLPVFFKACALSNTCASLSALHGPEMMNGKAVLIGQSLRGAVLNFGLMFTNVHFGAFQAHSFYSNLKLDKFVSVLLREARILSHFGNLPSKTQVIEFFKKHSHWRCS